MKRRLAMVVLLAIMAALGLARAEGRELSDYFGRDIVSAAKALGDLTYAEGTEFKDNYVNDALALRGNGGKVTCIELRNARSGDSLCGVSVGMDRKSVKAFFEGFPMPWEYDEEIAWIVRADESNELNSEMLVVFFDENGKVNGAWYRASGA